VWYTSKHCPLQSPTSHLRQCIAVHFFIVFPIWRLPLSALTWHECWDFSSSLACDVGILYTEWSVPTSLPAGLLIWPCTWISVLALASNPSVTFSWKISSDVFSCLFCYARCVHWPLPGRIDERKFFPPFYCLPFKCIKGQHLVWSVHTSFILVVVQHCTWFYFLMCLPWRWCLNKNIFMGNG